LTLGAGFYHCRNVSAKLSPVPPPRRRATIRDVARAAGVSTTTVSDALNRRGRLPDATRERVTAVADALGYRARAGARALRAGRSGQIGLYCPFLAEIPGGLAGTGYYMELAMGAAEASLTRELALVLLPTGLTPERLAAIDIDGLIVADPLRDDPGVGRLASSGVTIVTCERDPTPAARHAGCVRSDHTAALRELLEHLAGAGARRIALVAAGEETAWSAELGRAYRAWCSERGAEALEARVPISPRPEYAERATTELLARAAPPDAIVCAPDGGAAAVVRAAVARGLSVPGDVLVASCVDGPLVAATAPPVTAIDLQPGLAGRRAASLLADLLAGRAEAGTEQDVPTRLVLRPSTTPGVR
jgi:DNA-binding LacI/PurR family transcriptional regulator